MFFCHIDPNYIYRNSPSHNIWRVFIYYILIVCLPVCNNK